MKIPRDLGAGELGKALRGLGYVRVRQEGSHICFTTTVNGTHHVTVPNHRPIKTGTLHGILKSIAVHHKLTVEELVGKFGL